MLTIEGYHLNRQNIQKISMSKSPITNPRQQLGNNYFKIISGINQGSVLRRSLFPLIIEKKHVSLYKYFIILLI